MFLSGEKVEGEGACQLRAQVLRVAASRVPPLALRLREGAHYFQAWAHLLWGGLVNDTTLVIYGKLGGIYGIMTIYGKGGHFTLESEAFRAHIRSLVMIWYSTLWCSICLWSCCTAGSRFGALGRVVLVGRAVLVGQVVPVVSGMGVRAPSGGRSPARCRSLCPAGLGL